MLTYQTAAKCLGAVFIAYLLPKAIRSRKSLPKNEEKPSDADIPPRNGIRLFLEIGCAREKVENNDAPKERPCYGLFLKFRCFFEESKQPLKPYESPKLTTEQVKVVSPPEDEAKLSETNAKSEDCYAVFFNVGVQL